jgi:hypothetical protein
VSDRYMVLIHRLAIRGFLIEDLRTYAVVELLVLKFSLLAHVSGLGINR